MSSLNSIYITEETLKVLLEVTQKKGAKGVGITLAISDETNKYGQNLSGYVSQTKEEREAKKNRFYIGSGKTFWTDGKITIAEKRDMPQINSNDDDLPF